MSWQTQKSAQGVPVILVSAGVSKNGQYWWIKSQWNAAKNWTHTLWLSHKIKSFLVFKIAFTHKQLYINYTDTWVLIQYLQKRIQLCNRHLTGTVQSMLIRGHSWSRTSSRIGDSLGFHYLKSCHFVPLLYIKFFTCISNHWLELIILSQSYYNPVKCKTKQNKKPKQLHQPMSCQVSGGERTKIREDKNHSKNQHLCIIACHPIKPLDKVSRALIPWKSRFINRR